MNAIQNSNTIPNIRLLISSDHGQNYWFNGCAGYIMECLNEPDYDYWFFAGLTGENFAQVYALNGGFLGNGVVEYLLNSDTISPNNYFENLFSICGYTSTYVDGKELRKDTDKHLLTLMTYIDKRIPVMLYGYEAPPFGIIVGYEEQGKQLLYITGNEIEPKRISIETAIGNDDIERFGWLFIGDKSDQKELRQIYRDVITSLPQLLTTNTDKYCFGAEAFRTWAADIENGRFNDMTPEQLYEWSTYLIYICCLATNSGGCQEFLKRAQELNPDFTILEDVRKQYLYTCYLWNCSNWRDVFNQIDFKHLKVMLGNDSLESLGGGFNITLENLQTPETHSKIVATIRKFADYIDEVVRIIQERTQRPD